MSEQLWVNDPSILFSAQTWQKFVPTKDMDVPAALNSVVRFTVYFAVLLYVGSGKTSYLLAIPFVLVLTIIFSKVFPTTRDLVETFITPSKVVELKRYTSPTAENPFMNVLLTEIGDDPNRPDAAPITSNKVKKQVQKAFQQTSDIYMDTSDRFDQTQAMRTFHTLQSSTVPNNQDGFLEFLAKGIDEPDFSSAFPSRNAKTKSETYVSAVDRTLLLPNGTLKPTGTKPSSTSFNSS
jgi:hypothetical protein